MTAADPIPTIDRARGIGGTDISAIVGLSPYRTPFDVWAEKTGQLKREDKPNPRQRWGKLLEQAIATGYCEVVAERTGKCIAFDWDDKTHRHERFPWMVWTPDGHRFSAPTEDGPWQRESIGIDAKNVAFDQAHLWGEQGTDEVPEWINCQFQWYMEAEDFDQWDAAVLFGGNDFRIYTVLRDREIGAVLLERGEEFWKKNILGGEQPELGAGEGARRYLRQRFPKHVADMRQATADELAMIGEYRAARELREEWEEQETVLSNRIKLAIGEGEGLTFPDGRITWKKDRDSWGTNWEAVAGVLKEALSLSTKNDSETTHYFSNVVSAHQIVTREGPRKLVPKFGTQKRSNAA